MLNPILQLRPAQISSDSCAIRHISTFLPMLHDHARYRRVPRIGGPKAES